MKTVAETSKKITATLRNGETREFVIPKGAVLAAPIVEILDEEIIPEGEEELWRQS